MAKMKVHELAKELELVEAEIALKKARVESLQREERIEELFKDALNSFPMA